MRAFTLGALLTFVISVYAIPFTPSAPELQRRAEQFRLEGLNENEIATKLSLLDSEAPEEPQHDRPSLSSRLYSIFHDSDEAGQERDLSGDIPPGSLDSPEMLPRHVAPGATRLERIIAVLRKEDAKQGYAYEGKELELRRPTGMRHWGSEDKWRLF